MNQFDQLHRYLFTDASVRGELVRLQDTLKPIVHSTDYPLAIQQLLAEMAAATSLLTATLKFEGEVGLQIQSQGKVRYAVVNATHEQTLRGVARWDEEADLSTASFADLVANAVLVITITPTEGERYQGVVALDKGSLAGCIEDYFERSEQLATRVFIHTDLADKDAPKVAGMFLQVVPTSSEATNVTADSEFEHLCTLTETMTAEELFALPAQDVLYRLYHEQTLEVYAPEAVTFACTCSRERSAEALRNIDKAELLAIIKEEGSINMNCQYCHTEYRFDEIDVEALKSGYNNAPEASQ